MSSRELENLVRSGDLVRSARPPELIRVLRERGRVRLVDAANRSNALASRFDLAYNGAHSLALAALHQAGYVPENRHIVFQALMHTTRLDHPFVRILDRAHTLRNAFEYRGEGEIDERFITDLIAAGKALAALLPEP